MKSQELNDCWPDSSWTVARQLAPLVTELAESGAGAEVVMRIVGHVSRAILSRYSHARSAALWTRSHTPAESGEVPSIGDPIVRRFTKSGPEREKQFGLFITLWHIFISGESGSSGAKCHLRDIPRRFSPIHPAGDSLVALGTVEEVRGNRLGYDSKRISFAIYSPVKKSVILF